jgi:ABC-2 type transport system ATP-binding protein
MIRAGHLVSTMSMEQVHAMRVQEVQIEFASSVPEAALRSTAGVRELRVDGMRATCTVQGDFTPLLAALRDSEVTRLISREPSLESIFLSFYSR